MIVSDVVDHLRNAGDQLRDHHQDQKHHDSDGKQDRNDGPKDVCQFRRHFFERLFFKEMHEGIQNIGKDRACHHRRQNLKKQSESVKEGDESHDDADDDQRHVRTEPCFVFFVLFFHVVITFFHDLTSVAR